MPYSPHRVSGPTCAAHSFRQVQSFSFGNLDELETGKLITRLTNDVIQVQEMVMMMLRIMVRAPLMLVGSLIMAILTSPQLALLFVVLIPIVLVFLIWIINKTFPLFGTVQEKLDAINTVMQENLAGMRVVKAFSRSDYEIDRFGDGQRRLDGPQSQGGPDGRGDHALHDAGPQPGRGGDALVRRHAGRSRATCRWGRSWPSSTT